MKVIVFLFTIGLAVSASAKDKIGPWINASVGLGAIDSQAAGSWNVSAGSKFSSRLFGGVFGNGCIGVDGDVVSVFALGMRGYPVKKSGFNLTGGLGTGWVNKGKTRTVKSSILLGIGHDFALTKNLYLTPYMNSVGLDLWQIHLFQWGVGITLK